MGCAARIYRKNSVFGMGTNSFQWLTQAPDSYENWEPPPELAGSAFAMRRLFFERHPEHCNSYVVCPACGYPTLSCRNGYDYCSLCHWEDDGQDDHWADQPNCRPNDGSLAQARMNFADTYSVWSPAEKNDFSQGNQYRIFSETAQREKKKLCGLYDRLLSLETDEQIRHQWQLIDEQWKIAP